MAYEVTKVVRGHSYRYQVESYRDDTGKVRNRWTYLGRVDGDVTRPPSKRSTAETRERLIDALDRLLEGAEYSSVTAGSIATEAGLAHGTFYRYFRHKREALEAAMTRVNDGVDRARERLREPVVASLPSERARLREVLLAVLTQSLAHSGVVRTWHALMSNSTEMTNARMERRRVALADLADYFERLRHAGLTDISNPQEVAAAVAAALGGAIQLRLSAGAGPTEEVSSGIVAIVERAVFHRDFPARMRDETAQSANVS